MMPRMNGGLRMKITKIYHPEEHRRAKQNVLRVAAYCRVSTKFEEQEESFETQQAVYTDKINNQEGWEMAGIYAEEERSYPAQKLTMRTIPIVTHNRYSKRIFYVFLFLLRLYNRYLS